MRSSSLVTVLYTSVFADGTRGTTALTEEACDFVTKNIAFL